MKIEVRADGCHISGYVNTTGKPSRPVITPHGKCIEIVEERTFEKALSRAGELTVTVDHENGHVYASSSDGTLQLYEDNIGLHADVHITDPTLIDIAKKGKIKGWSFGMRNVIDRLEERAGDIPIRYISDLDLDHLTLVVKKRPVYAATSVEVRAEGDLNLEYRAFDNEIKLSVIEAKPDYSNYEKRINALKNVR